jgi:hypothetical protein
VLTSDDRDLPDEEATSVSVGEMRRHLVETAGHGAGQRFSAPKRFGGPVTAGLDHNHVSNAT